MFVCAKCWKNFGEMRVFFFLYVFTDFGAFVRVFLRIVVLFLCVLWLKRDIFCSTRARLVARNPPGAVGAISLAVGVERRRLVWVLRYYPPRRCCPRSLLPSILAALDPCCP